MTLGALTFEASLGRNGTTAFKREGDGKTPLGTMPLLYGYRRANSPLWPSSPLALQKASRAEGWCDDPAASSYNRPVRLPFSMSHEKLIRDDGIYDIVIVMGWNIRPRIRNRGSAVFFHLARPGFQPTAGCVAITPQAMRVLLPHLKRGVRLVVRG